MPAKFLLPPLPLKVNICAVDPEEGNKVIIRLLL
jgi:hypothetical protein